MIMFVLIFRSTNVSSQILLASTNEPQLIYQQVVD
jgi:hypothetical protein